ncbi:MAG: hypothetical protein ACO1O6_00620 [Bacteroidota bacterium]
MFTVDDVDMSDLDELDDELTSQGLPPNLPHANIVLVFGILAVLLPFIGFFFGVAAVMFHRKNKELFVFDKLAYRSDYKKSQAGFTLGIIGMVLTFLSVFAYYVLRVWWFFWVILWIFGLFTES